MLASSLHPEEASFCLSVEEEGSEVAKWLNDLGITVFMLGFSAGGSVTLSVLYQAQEKNRPNFAAAIYTSDLNPNNGLAPSYKVPIFLAAASDDSFGLTPVSISTYEKWQKAKQSAELHIYEKGGHGPLLNSAYILFKRACACSNSLSRFTFEDSILRYLDFQL